MKVIEVAGATGNYKTDFQGKANAAADGLLNGLDFVYVHMEAADECGHHGDYKTHSQMLFAGLLPSFIRFTLTG